MATEDSRKVTCDGCGASRTFVLGKDKRADFAPWYRLNLEVQFQTIGQPDQAPNQDAFIDACSSDCAIKSLTKRLPALPKALAALK